MSTVSVVIPTYNRAAALPHAVESALQQTRSPLEILIVDDGSVDATPAVAARFAAPVRYIRQENGGVAAARNRGIREARGEYIALLDSDDLWNPTKLEVQLAVHEANPATGCSLTSCEIIDLEGRPLPELNGFEEVFAVFRALGQSPEAFFSQALERTEIPAAGDRHTVYCGDCFELLFYGNFVLPSSALVHRRVLEVTGAFDESFRFGEETEFFHRVASVAPLAVVMTPLVGRRIGDEDAMTASGNEPKFIEGALRSNERAGRLRGELSASEQRARKLGRELLQLRLAYYYLSVLDGRKARSVIAHAWRTHATRSPRAAAIYTASLLPARLLRALHALKRALRP